MGDVVDFSRYQRDSRAVKYQKLMRARRLIGEAVGVLAQAGERENELALLLEDFTEHLLRDYEADECYIQRPE